MLEKKEVKLGIASILMVLFIIATIVLIETLEGHKYHKVSAMFTFVMTLVLFRYLAPRAYEKEMREVLARHQDG